MSCQVHSPASFPSGNAPPSNHWIGGWVDPRAGLGVFRYRYRESNPGCPVRSLVTILTEFFRLQVRWEGVGWIHLAQGRDQWRAIVGTVMNNQVS
jgi:hypothetical protein